MKKLIGISIIVSALIGETQFGYQERDLRGFDATKNLNDAYTYVNMIRAKVGLKEFKKNSLLETMANNHSLFLSSNNVASHYESDNYSNFTGYDPSARAKYVGYNYRSISENIDFGKMYAKDAVDSLMTAIYHRLGFLSPLNDEIGISFTTHPYYKYLSVYNMGSQNSINSTAPAIYPFENQDKVSIDFYSDDEDPDPVPSTNRVGYPVSITFPYNAKVSKTAFNLYDSSGKIISATAITDSHIDPNEFVIIPNQPLSYATTYKASFNGVWDSKNYTKSWNFKTVSLDNFTSNPKELKIAPNQSKHIYLFGGSGSYVKYAYNYYNPNPVSSIKLNGNEITFSTNSNSGKVTLKAYDSEDRVLTINVDVSSANSSVADVTYSQSIALYEINNNSSTTTTTTNTTTDTTNTTATTPIATTNDIPPPPAPPSTTDCNQNVMNMVTISNKWHLLGTSIDGCTKTKLKALGATTIWAFDPVIQNYKTDDVIKAGEGFWIKK
jgi:uncharacterized protein YkwD